MPVKRPTGLEIDRRVEDAHRKGNTSDGYITEGPTKYLSGNGKDVIAAAKKIGGILELNLRLDKLTQFDNMDKDNPEYITELSYFVFELQKYAQIPASDLSRIGYDYFANIEEVVKRKEPDTYKGLNIRSAL
ncbi:hypothetical protein HN777_00295 [Candidatus Woesearchaeota archaeon]|jgi:hypothetical protein|nr:hypothetical protein [Candidatus Woesearchaeota archaeon]MBT7402214.1 hypothetical protein [Candidatus Woesearchaeota archaeon]